MADKVERPKVLDFLVKARALRGSRLEEGEMVSPSRDEPIKDSLYSLAMPLYRSTNLPISKGYNPNGNGPGAA